MEIFSILSENFDKWNLKIMFFQQEIQQIPCIISVSLEALTHGHTNF
jgi:hypothetical protein